MTFSIPDDILREAGLNERELLVEIACRLFDAEKISKASAGRICGLSRVDFEAALYARGLDVYHASLEEYEKDRVRLNLGQNKKAG
jgi:predicted HTH domain antitoxin